MFSLELVFVGLIAFFDQSGSGQFYALMVDARTYPTEEHRADGLHLHQPFLSFSMENWSTMAGNRQPDRVVVDARGEEVGVIWLDREELRVVSPSTSPLFIPKDPRIKGESPAIGQESDLRWVIDMKDLNYPPYQFQHLKATSLASPVQAPLVGRFVVTAGSGGVAKIGRRRELGAPVEIFSFDPPDVTYKQALADQIVVKLSITGSESVFDSDRRAPLTLRPTVLKPEVRVVVGNLPLDVNVYSGGPATHVRDFKWFFELVQPAPD